MTAASKATIVVAFPGAGPTCFTITLLCVVQLLGERCDSACVPASGGLGDRVEGSLVMPNGPDDSGQLVGDRDRGRVVHVSLGEVVRPLT